MLTESTVAKQTQDVIRATQAETDARLDALIAEQRRTNQLLEWVGTLLAAKVSVSA
jgi:transposase